LPSLRVGPAPVHFTLFAQLSVVSDQCCSRPKGGRRRAWHTTPALWRGEPARAMGRSDADAGNAPDTGAREFRRAAATATSIAATRCRAMRCHRESSGPARAPRRRRRAGARGGATPSRHTEARDAGAAPAAAALRLVACGPNARCNARPPCRDWSSGSPRHGVAGGLGADGPPLETCTCSPARSLPRPPPC
jgi:hypothetical protein